MAYGVGTAYVSITWVSVWYVLTSLVFVKDTTMIDEAEPELVTYTVSRM